MRPSFRPFALALACLIPLSLPAQTYTPKKIVLEGPDAADTAQFLSIAALKPGAPITKQEIEDALHRLGDTGMFSSLSYTVNADALVFKLTMPPGASRSLPARYANFVWWQPSELQPLVEARLPIFHGEVPITGTLSDQVDAVLTTLLKEKGIDAKVDAVQQSPGVGLPANAIAFTITRPQILLGNIQFQGTQPELSTNLTAVQHEFSGQDFDLTHTPSSIRDSGPVPDRPQLQARARRRRRQRNKPADR